MKGAPAAALLFAAVVAGSVSPPSFPSEARGMAPSLCAAEETVVYNCRFGRKTGSICAGRNRAHYRFGTSARNELQITSAADWSNVRLGRVTGQQGGHQSHVRFSNGDTHYIVFEGADGQLSRRPGYSYSGIAVVAGERELARLECRGAAAIASGMTEAVRALAPVPLRGRLDETRESFFDGWF